MIFALVMALVNSPEIGVVPLSTDDAVVTSFQFEIAFGLMVPKLHDSTKFSLVWLVQSTPLS